MRYFAKITAGYACKNRLQEAIKEMALKVDRTILENKDDRDALTEKLKSNIAELNEQHKRCTPEELCIQDYGKKWIGYRAGMDHYKITLSVPGVFHLDVYEEKEESGQEFQEWRKRRYS